MTRKLVLSLAAAAVLTVGASAFVPVYGCGSGGGPSGCKSETVDPQPAERDLLTRTVDWLVSLLGG